MDTLLYVGQIVVGALVLVAGLALSGRLPERFRTPSMPVTGYAVPGCGEGMGTSCRFGVFFAVAAIVFGVAGLAGYSTLPAVVGVLVTGIGLISVLLSAETTPVTYRVTDDEVRVMPTPRSNVEIAAAVSPMHSEAARRRVA